METYGEAGVRLGSEYPTASAPHLPSLFAWPAPCLSAQRLPPQATKYQVASPSLPPPTYPLTPTVWSHHEAWWFQKSDCPSGPWLCPDKLRAACFTSRRAKAVMAPTFRAGARGGRQTHTEPSGQGPGTQGAQKGRSFAVPPVPPVPLS